MNDPFATRPPVHKEVPPAHADAGLHPEWIGRYRVERVLGKGSFGLVYLAHDEKLSRPVAIKVPHSRLVAQAADAEAYLTEARTIANLDHPHIVPVFDVGSTERFPCFVVSKYIDGTDLATKQKQSPLSLHEAVQLVATVAEALHHAHKQGLVHRDIKPGNLLLDKGGQPFVGDFGLALREQDVGKGPRYTGTPAYMSPEQARGEGHRVDGRSDIFSLGVVFYVLMTGRRAFHADSLEELLEQIANREVRPPRQWDDTIPKALERICLKALAKRASERYTTAKDMADDLRHFFKQATDDKMLSPHSSISAVGIPTPIPSSIPSPSPISMPTDAENPSGKPQRWGLTAGMLILLVFLIGGAILAWSKWGKVISNNVPPAEPRVEPRSVFLPLWARNLATSPVLTLLAEGQPLVPPGDIVRPRFALDLLARRKGVRQFTPLADGASLASQEDQYLLVIRPQTPGYLYVFQIDTRGTVSWFWPKNDTWKLSAGSNPVTAGKRLLIPPEERRTALFLDQNVGVEHVLAVFAAARWPELEAALKSAARAASIAKDVPEPLDLMRGGEDDTRGPGGEQAIEVDLGEDRVRLDLPAQELAAVHSFLIVSHWFRHVAPAGQ